MKWSGDGGVAAEWPSDSVVERMLHEVMVAALRKSGSSQVFLELFSGSGAVAARIRAESGYTCICIDIKYGAHFDITNRKVASMILGWISSGLIRGVWLAVPCSTWSRARWIPWRTWLHIYGIPGLKEHQKAAVLLGNKTLAFARRVINMTIKCGIPAALENPATSQMWGEPGLRNLLNHRSSQQVVFDMCKFGTPWRKRTRIAAWHGAGISFLRRLCPSKLGRCWTGKPHIILQGRPRGGSIPWTKVAEPYPPALATDVARWLLRSADGRAYEHLAALAC